MFYPVVASVTIVLLYTFVKLASTSPQSLFPPSCHANMARILPAIGALVGALFSAKPLSFVGSRQHGPDFPGPPAPLLAPCSPQALIPSSGHANTVRIFSACRRPCWRLVPRKAFVLRRATPTRSGFSLLADAPVGALFPAKPLSSVGPRQHGPDFLCLPTPLLAPCSPQSLYLSSGRANMARFSPVHRCPCCYNFRKRRRKGAVALNSTTVPFCTIKV